MTLPVPPLKALHSLTEMVDRSRARDAMIADASGRTTEIKGRRLDDSAERQLVRRAIFSLSRNSFKNATGNFFVYVPIDKRESEESSNASLAALTLPAKKDKMTKGVKNESKSLIVGRGDRVRVQMRRDDNSYGLLSRSRQ